MKRTRLVTFLSCIVVALATIICRCNAETFATRLSAGGVSDHLMLREGDADAFKRYSQAKLTMMRESIGRAGFGTLTEHQEHSGTANVH